MTLPHLIEAAVGAGLVGFVAYRLAKLPAALRAGTTAQALTGQPVIDPPLADQPAALPWVAQLSATTAGRGTQTTGTAELGAGDWYDPTAASFPQTFNEFGFITSPSPAPVNPKTGAVPLTNADVCAWVGHAPGTPCPRCGVAQP